MVSNFDREKFQIGIKQVSRALRDDRAMAVFVAIDAEVNVTHRIVELAKEKSVPIHYVATMNELGRFCHIDVGAAAAVIIK